MKKMLILAAALAVGGCMAEPPPRISAEAQSRLTAALQGRVQAGPPVSCVSSRLLRGNESVGEDAIIFKTIGSDLVYVNRPRSGCPEIRSARSLVIARRRRNAARVTSAKSSIW
jgi:hypothetical protein